MDRRTAPLTSLPDKLEIKFPEKRILENGVELYWMKDVPDESVKLDIDWQAGSKYQSIRLTSSFASRLLLSGTKDLNALKISEEIDFHGGYFSLSADLDNASVTLYGLRKNMKRIFAAFSEAFDGAVFPEEELSTERKIALEHFRIDQEKVKVICRKHFNSALFGERSSYGSLTVEGDFASFRRSDVLEFYHSAYKGSRPTIFLVGNVGKDFIAQLQAWSSGFTCENKKLVSTFEPQKTGDFFIPHKNALQCAIRVGRRIVDKNHPDYFVFQVLNTLLGGYFGSRLMANIREDKGLTYGIGSGVASMEDASFFFISTETGVEFREKVIAEIFNETERLRFELVSEEELTKVKNFLLGEFLRQSDGPIPMMDCFKNLWYHQLSDDYYNRFIQAVRSCTPEQVRESAQKYLDKKQMITVVSG